MGLNIASTETQSCVVLADGSKVVVESLRGDMFPVLDADPLDYVTAHPPNLIGSFEIRVTDASELFRALRVERSSNLRLTVVEAPRLPSIWIDLDRGVYRVFFNGRQVCSRRRHPNAVRVATALKSWAETHRPAPVQTTMSVRCVAIHENARSAAVVFNAVEMQWTS